MSMHIYIHIYIYTYIYESLWSTPKLTQHCKSTIFQFKKIFLKYSLEEFYPTLASRSFTICGCVFTSLIHFELNFVSDATSESSFTILHVSTLFLTPFFN